MNIKRKNSGFTLLEIIIVIIIIGVLASLALPRLFSTIEFSRSAEALAAFTSIRSSMERCRLQNADVFTGCGDGGFNEIDVDDPGLAANAHYTYGIAGIGAGGDAEAYTITATRNAVDGGDGASTIVLSVTGAGIVRTGTGSFEGIK